MHNAYGARKLLQRYLGLRSDKVLRIPELVWQHGWLTEIHNRDPDTLVGESGQTSHLPHLTYFVAREDQARALQGFGIENAYPIGLPFAYALKRNKEEAARIPKSVLIMPSAHGSFPDSEEAHLDRPYISFAIEELRDFRHKVVLMNCDDFQNGRHLEWKRNGFQVEMGGCHGDDTSLERLVSKFSQFDVMTTNGFGSHVVYAGAAGCRVSIAGPGPEGASADAWWEGEFYVNRPDLVQIETEILAETARSFEALGILVKPNKARDVTSWGLEQIGASNVREPGELLDLITSAYRRHWPLGDRLGFRPVRKKLESIRRTAEVSRLTEGSKRSFSPLARLSNLAHLLGRSTDQQTTTLRFLDTRKVLHFRPGTSDEWSLHRHFIEREWDALDLGNPDRILCLGSYAGYSLRYLARRFPLASIVGVEADADNIAVSTLNTGAIERIRVLNVAVGSEDGEVSVLKGTDSEWSSKSIPVSSKHPTVQSMNLFSLLEQVGWGRVDVMLVDIEGSEYEVLMSLAPQLKNLCGVLVVRFTHRLARKDKLDEIVANATREDLSNVTTVGDLTVFDFR